MKIEVGKKYEIRPIYKKSLAEFLCFNKENRYVLIENVLQAGGVCVRIDNESEVNLLESHLKSESPNRLLDFSYFTNVEPTDDIEECYQGFTYEGFNNVHEEEELDERLSEDGYMCLYDEGWDELYPKYYIEGRVLIEEVDYGREISARDN